MQKLLAEKIQSQKGLSIVYAINRIISRKKSVGETLSEIAREIPKGWQYSEYAYARIKFDGHEYRPANFRETRWIQKQIFETFDKKWGAIDVFYTKQFPRADEGPFLHEERQLLENIATIVSNYLNSLIASDTPMGSDLDTAVTFERTRKISEERNIDDALFRICRNMPRSWQFPDYAVARIEYDGREYLSSDRDYSDHEWSLREDFTTIDHKSGTIEFFYLRGFPATYRETHKDSEKELLWNMANLITGFINIIKGNEIRQPSDREEKQNEDARTDNRIFSCINEISKSLRNGHSLETTFSEIIELIPMAFRFPEHIVCLITYDNAGYRSPGYRETPVFLEAAFKTISLKSGSVRIDVTGDEPEAGEELFLEEEKQFSETLALLISGFINLIHGLDSVIATQEGLKEILYEKTERLKELSCINQTTSILQSEKTVENALKRIVYILPDAWQYPEHTVARISFEDRKSVV
mgnify:FL=1